MKFEKGELELSTGKRLKVVANCVGLDLQDKTASSCVATGYDDGINLDDLTQEEQIEFCTFMSLKWLELRNRLENKE